MQLVAILLNTVSILTLLSGAAVFFGATKGDRLRSAWFFIATIFATIWMVTIGIFITATIDTDLGLMAHIVNWTYASSVFIDIALLGYISWKQRYGKILTITFFTLGVILSTVFFMKPSLLYTEIILSNSGNSLVTNVGPFYFIFIAFFCCLVPAVMITLLSNIIHPTSKKVRSSDIVLLIGFGISGTMSLIFNLILPFWTWDLVWLGPIAISTTIIAFYYTVLKYRTINLSSIWLKILSYIVIIASIAILYMVVFYIIFTAMFRGSTPSTEVIILNFVMVLFFLLLMPAMSRLLVVVRSLISSQSTTKKDHTEHD